MVFRVSSFSVLRHWVVSIITDLPTLKNKLTNAAFLRFEIREFLVSYRKVVTRSATH
nr:MAG TPA: hypothetical protein [Caudoviricetes sp.]DAT61075.1 MAG TPA: hypothetical protein [Caudoviricetes sp.]